MNETNDLTIGWFGKLPSLGDFVSRRLPTNFVEPWDTWLQEAITASRTQLGEQWQEIYLTSPIWRFVLMPGIYGNTEMWTGVLMPSVDKVGRHFPLTIATPVKPHPGMMQSVVAAQAWYAELEQVALASLDFDISPDALDDRLAQHPFPGLLTHYSQMPSREFSDWWQNKSWQDMDAAHKVFRLTTADSLSRLFEDTISDVFNTSGSGKSIWWTVEFETGLTQMHCFIGLPPTNYFSTLLINDAK